MKCLLMNGRLQKVENFNLGKQALFVCLSGFMCAHTPSHKPSHKKPFLLPPPTFYGVMEEGRSSQESSYVLLS